MKTLLSKCLTVVLAAFLLINIPSRAQDIDKDAFEAAALILMPQIEVTTANKSAWHEYVRRVDEATWAKKKKDASFLGDLNAAYEGLPFKLNADAKYSDFDESRRKYFEKINYIADERESFMVFRQFLTDTQVTEYTKLVSQILSKGGWRVYEQSASPQNVALEIIWITPQGINTTPEYTATILGGKVPGAEDGQLFPKGYKLQNGSQSVSVIREKSSELIVALSAAGRSITHTVPSAEDVELSTASPVGTIITSMLPPHRYSDVTKDKANWYPKKAKWVPADGREVAGSSYASLVASHVPDLRGQFLRGLNQFESASPRADGKQDPGGDGRQAGSFQDDSVGAHQHSYRDMSAVWGADRGSPTKRIDNDAGDEVRTTEAMDTSKHAETRPQNIAVYYYIRIN